jgi:toxin ParE1/3/4
VATVRWTRRALDDLDAIALFIARDSPRAAEELAQRVFREVERLSDFPRSGRMVPEAERDEYRELLVSSYRVFYRLGDDLIEILRVHHGARRFPGVGDLEDSDR